MAQGARSPTAERRPHQRRRNDRAMRAACAKHVIFIAMVNRNDAGIVVSYRFVAPQKSAAGKTTWQGRGSRLWSRAFSLKANIRAAAARGGNSSRGVRPLPRPDRQWRSSVEESG